MIHYISGEVLVDLIVQERGMKIPEDFVETSIVIETIALMVLEDVVVDEDSQTVFNKVNIVTIQTIEKPILAGILP
jgi:hypothetical protein